ncbi:uncharacterized protein [Magallana gigas]|uniref:uncharacterized protein isoform X2 n=1 Tax=Magallana gigas TaxID=29159 RepID=UPI00333F21DA
MQKLRNQVAAIVLVSSSEDISTVKPCELEEVLVSLRVNNTSTCKYNVIKNKTACIRNWGISLSVLIPITFLLILNYIWIPNYNKICIRVRIAGIIVAGGLAVMYAVIMIYFYKKVLDYEEIQTDTNYAQIKSSMIARLKESYSSDNVTSGGAISNSWNRFFIEYDCCAINQVQGTINDFDSTPWCTTSGSCQATASQIPKTCCNGVSEDDYGSALSNCHSSVNPGTYKSNCMIPIKTLSVVHIEEWQVSLLRITLLTIGTLEIAEIIIEGMMLSAYIYFIRKEIWPERNSIL